MKTFCISSKGKFFDLKDVLDFLERHNMVNFHVLDGKDSEIFKIMTGHSVKVIDKDEEKKFFSCCCQYLSISIKQDEKQVLVRPIQLIRWDYFVAKFPSLGTTYQEEVVEKILPYLNSSQGF